MSVIVDGKVVAVGRPREWKDKAGVLHETVTVTVSDGEELVPVQFEGGRDVPAVDCQVSILCSPPVTFIGGRPVAQELRARAKGLSSAS